MPIVRTYACPECNHYMRVTLTAEQVDQEPPICPRCASWDFDHRMEQDFQPPAIRGTVGSNRFRATRLAEEIARTDFGVSDMKTRGPGEAPKVRYSQSTNPQDQSRWGANREVVEMAAQLGRGSREKYGSGLDVIKTMPDLIEISKKRSARIW